jgi:hypothetical protein
LLRVLARAALGGPPKAEPGAAAGRGGAQRSRLDLDGGTLQIEPTRVVVDGKVIESDGKTVNAQHLLALDPFTLAVLKAQVDQLAAERRDFGPGYHDDGWLFCWENGKPPHPDTFTRRFKKLAGRACPRLTYMTCGTATRLRAGTRRSTGRRCPSGLATLTLPSR